MSPRSLLGQLTWTWHPRGRADISSEQSLLHSSLPSSSLHIHRCACHVLSFNNIGEGHGGSPCQEHQVGAMVMIQPLGALGGRLHLNTRAQTSMTGASSSCHVTTLLILLLVLRFTLASVTSPSPSTSSSPSSSSSSVSASLPSAPSASSSSSSSSSSLPPFLSSPSSSSSSAALSSPSSSSSSPSSSISSSVRPRASSIVSEASYLPEVLSAVSSHQESPTTLTHSQSESVHIQKVTSSTNQIRLSSVMETSTPSLDPSTPSPVTSGSRPETAALAQASDSTISKRTKLKFGVTDKQKKVLDALEKAFLKNAGLPARPRITQHFPVPEYVMELYRTRLKNPRTPNTYLIHKGKGLIAANTVRSFLHSEAENSACQTHQCSRVFFDVSTIPSEETLTGAELRIFVDTSIDSDEQDEATARSDPSSGVVGHPKRKRSSGVSQQHRLEVHEIMKPAASDGGDVISRLLDTQVVKLQQNSTWQSFDIHPAVLKWKRDSRHNHGLEIRLVSKSPSLSTDKHVRLRRSAHSQDKEWALQRPLLVVFTDDGLSLDSSSKSSSSSLSRLRRKRSANKNNKKEKRKKNRKKKKKKKRRRKKKGNKNECKRHGLTVDFTEVGWDDWIVAPPGYNAYYCHGTCMAPIPDYAKASNHAILQARVYKVNPSAVPMVCCVPIKMSPLPMVYRDERGQAGQWIVKTYQDMMVDECGCN